MDIIDWFDAPNAKTSFDAPLYNVCPSQNIPAVVFHAGERHLVDFRWGFIPHWYASPSDGPLLINARAETLSKKPAFRQAAISRRCLIPASGFYEWHQAKGAGKEPWCLKPKSVNLMAFAGIWQAWTARDGSRKVTCAVVTTASGSEISKIHHREPVVIGKDKFGLWLGQEGKGAAGLMRSTKDGFYTIHRVSTAVNSARHNNSVLMESIE